MSSSPYDALEVSRVSVVRDGHQLLSDVNFNVPQGETAVLVGANGSGKTTLLRAVLSLLPVAKGTIQIFGKSARKAHGELGYVPQTVTFDRSFPVTAAEVVGMNLWNAGLQDEERRARVAWALGEVSAASVAGKQVGELSGGQLQRVLIARAIARHPRLLILDEPAAGIDAPGEEAFYELLKRLKGERELTVLMVSHDIDVVYKYATHVICLSGTVLCQGTPKETLTEEVFQKMYGDDASYYRHRHPAHGHSHGEDLDHSPELPSHIH